jgi:photosystem II stability/assembly factor-like uncharacterized protein
MNKLVGILFSLFVVSAVVFAFSPRTDPPMPPTAVHIEHLLILDARALGSRLISVGERGHIFVSENAGRDWRRADSPTSATLTAIGVVDDRRVVAAGHDGVILLSEDAGEHWRTVFAAPDEEEPLLSVWFDADGRGFAVGAYGRFLASHDGGATWEMRDLDGNDFHFNAMARVGDALLIGGEAGTLLRSNDDGESWDALDSPYEGSFFGLLALSDDSVLAFGMRGHVYRSDNAGDDWVELDTGTLSSIFGGHVLADGRVVLAGQNGLILVSDDAVQGFSRLEVDTSLTFSKVIASGLPNELILVGEHGVTRLTIDNPREKKS